MEQDATLIHPFSTQLIAWYDDHKRDLPWRSTTNPYYIWLSEVILQQTRVAQGLAYYLRFVDRFPTVDLLAAANEQEVLNLWQGLGYYSRARNLHAAARTVVDCFEGRFPQTYAEIRSLKGVGDYTAAAIASFAFDLPHAVVDGNVQRVLSRLFGVETPIDSTAGKREIVALADELLDPRRAALHNQAIMEFGALQCTPTSPACGDCPMQSTCAAFERGLVKHLPVKAGKTKVTTRYFHYFLIKDSTGRILLRKRLGDDIWKNLYEFPMVETDRPAAIDELLADPLIRLLTSNDATVGVSQVCSGVKHVLSHRILLASLFELTDSGVTDLPPNYLRIAPDELEHYPIPRLMERLWEHVAQ